MNVEYFLTIFFVRTAKIPYVIRQKLDLIPIGWEGDSMLGQIRKFDFQVQSSTPQILKVYKNCIKE